VAGAELMDFDEDLGVETDGEIYQDSDDSVVVETDGEMYQDSDDDVDSELFAPWSAPSDWTITINSYDVTVVLALLVVLCSVTLFMVACSRKSSKRVYSPVKFMESDTEREIEIQPINQ